MYFHFTIKCECSWICIGDNSCNTVDLFSEHAQSGCSCSNLTPVSMTTLAAIWPSLVWLQLLQRSHMGLLSHLVSTTNLSLPSLTDLTAVCACRILLFLQQSEPAWSDWSYSSLSLLNLTILAAIWTCLVWLILQQSEPAESYYSCSNLNLLSLADHSSLSLLNLTILAAIWIFLVWLITAVWACWILIFLQQSEPA